jgi:hypothetical protein
MFKTELNLTNNQVQKYIGQRYMKMFKLINKYIKCDEIY